MRKIEKEEQAQMIFSYYFNFNYFYYFITKCKSKIKYETDGFSMVSIDKFNIEESGSEKQDR